MKETIHLIDGNFPTSTPDEQGIPSSAIAGLINEVDKRGGELHSLQIVRNGKLAFSAAAAPFTVDSPHRAFSLAKGITMNGVLFAVQEGKISLDSRVVDYFPEFLPANLDPKYDKLTVYHLLTMSAGQTQDAFIRILQGRDEHMSKLFFEIPLEHMPGTKFFYNNAVPHMLACIAEKATGEKLADYLASRLTGPLGIQLRMQPTKWGYYDLATTTLSPTAMLKMSLFYLQEGAWDGKQLLNPALARTVGEYHMSNWKAGLPGNAVSGYGFQLWRNSFGGYRFDGGRMQYSIVLPDVDMAVCMTADEDKVPLLDIFQDEIYRRIQKRSLPVDTGGIEALRLAVANFNLAPKDVSAFSPMLRSIDGVEFKFAPNEAGVESLMLRSGSGIELGVRRNGETRSAHCGLEGNWAVNGRYILFDPDVGFENGIFGPDPEQCLLSGGWKGKSFIFKLRSHASMGEYMAECDYSSGNLVLSFEPKVSIGRARLNSPIRLVSYTKV